jgi:hypothetical protein
MAWEWYGVKSLFETTASPRKRTARGNPKRSSSLIEERIILVYARTFNEAIRKSEKEATVYARGPTYRNRHGDVVRTKYLGVCNAFSIRAVPSSGIEVYSSMQVVSSKRLKAAIDTLMAFDALGKRDQDMYEPG